MNRISRAACLVAMGLTWNGFAVGQQTQYLRVNCVKVKSGKSAEFAAFLSGPQAKLAKFYVENGTWAAAIYAQAAYPSGQDAKCDYLLVDVSNGFPPELRTASQTDADLKKAGVNMSGAEFLAKRTELRTFVGAELWRQRAQVGGVKKDGYLRLNYFKTKPGMAAEWLRLENGWQKLAESAAQDLGTSWGLYTLTMPGGSEQPYNGLTVDAFPSWEAVGKGVPYRAIWNKVHPEQDYASYIDQVNATSDRPRIDVVKVIDVISK